MLKTSRVDADVRNEWILHLSEICRRYKCLPQSLRLDGIEQEGELLGHGGTADVYKAKLDGQWVAVKVLRPTRMDWNGQAARSAAVQGQWNVSTNTRNLLFRRC